MSIVAITPVSIEVRIEHHLSDPAPFLRELAELPGVISVDGSDPLYASAHFSVNGEPALMSRYQNARQDIRDLLNRCARQQAVKAATPVYHVERKNDSLFIIQDK